MFRFIRIGCTKPVGVEETLRLNRILDKYRPRIYPPRSEAKFYWNDLSSAELWAENCLLLGGKAKVWLVEVEGNCVECDFFLVEVLAEDKSLPEKEVEKWAITYWGSCRKPEKLKEIGNTEVLCWNVKEKRTLLAEIDNLEELQTTFNKIKKKLLQHKTLKCLP